jgi:succinyl-diaminopimelate desuccinylase
MITTNNTLELAKQLIARPSLTPEDAGCQAILTARLIAMGFTVTPLKFGKVDNLWARRGTEEPVLVLAGHTDIVPPGPLDCWTSDPFTPTIRDGNLYGRGAADMKSSLAVMVTACEAFLEKNPHHRGSIAFLITSDEEGAAQDGTAKVVDYLRECQEKIAWCIVGEASSEKTLGDVIKVGRRGSMHGYLTIYGKQGHIAYPQKAENPIHKALLALNELSQEAWDQGNEEFPPTSFQIYHIQGGVGADNVIPGEMQVHFNFRYSTAITAEQMQQRVLAILDKYKLRYQIKWRVSGLPFLTKKGELVTSACQAIKEFTHIEPQLSTSGGTSDGRFIATLGCQVIELGPINASIHQIDEHVSIQDLNILTKIYQKMMELLLA